MEVKERSRSEITYKSTKTKAKNFIMRDIILEDLKEFKKIVDERMIELKRG